ncbi:MAG TPA: TrkA family potassium uptake protein [Ktedonobacterales bacterium]|jgi:trk system potassium uptake protein TrkA
MKIIILGCGRVGATLAMMMDRAGHTVTVIDYNNDAFQRLESSFGGQTMMGDGIDEEVLRRAGIEEAAVFVATTNGDNRNIMASQIATKVFAVPKVICRIYDPIRTEVYRKLGLEVISPTLVGAELFREAIEESVEKPTSNAASRTR